MVPTGIFKEVGQVYISLLNYWDTITISFPFWSRRLKTGLDHSGKWWMNVDLLHASKTMLTFAMMGRIPREW